MLDLISTTEEVHYENYRQAQMEVRKFGEQKPRKFENPKFKEEEEREVGMEGGKRDDRA